MILSNTNPMHKRLKNLSVKDPLLLEILSSFGFRVGCLLLFCLSLHSVCLPLKCKYFPVFCFKLPLFTPRFSRWFDPNCGFNSPQMLIPLLTSVLPTPLGCFPGASSLLESQLNRHSPKCAFPVSSVRNLSHPKPPLLLCFPHQLHHQLLCSFYLLNIFWNC